MKSFWPSCFGIYIKNNSFIMAPLYWWNQSLYLKMVDIICTTTFWFGTYVLWICCYDINPFRKMKNSSFLICFINCLDKKPFTKTKTDKKCVIDTFQPNFPCLKKVFWDIFPALLSFHNFGCLLHILAFFEFIFNIWNTHILNKCWIYFQHFE